MQLDVRIVGAHDVISITELAALIGVNVHTLTIWVRAGYGPRLLPPVHGKTVHCHFTTADVVEWLKSPNAYRRPKGVRKRADHVRTEKARRQSDLDGQLDLEDAVARVKAA